MEPLDAFAREFFDRLASQGARRKEDVHLIKMRLLRTHHLDRVPSDADLMVFAPPDLAPELRRLMIKKVSRTMSGVTVVAAMTSPHECPHGKCIFCPGGTDTGTPQSYTGREPAAMRAADNSYDPYRQVRARLEQYEQTGHATDKIDLIIMGGTFPARELSYQHFFVKGCLDALNKDTSGSLKEAMRTNDLKEGVHKCIGLTVETRPDHCFNEHVRTMLSYGTTRVELGVQTISDSVLNAAGRGHSVADTVEATAQLKDHGLKVCYHMMPGLPTEGLDDFKRNMRELFTDQRFMPDMLKIYPTLVIEGTRLHGMYRSGEYVPPTLDELVNALADVKERLPPWVRVQRIQRDIPAQLIDGGCKASNLRQLVHSELGERGTRCNCIRCREVGRAPGTPGKIEEREARYDASGGREVFLSLESEDPPLIMGYCRLRLPPRAEGNHDGLPGPTAAIVRELKVLGESLPISTTGTDAWQHRGLGQGMMERAMRIAREEGYERLAVMSGIGVRGYYARLGYAREGPYMVRNVK